MSDKNGSVIDNLWSVLANAYNPAKIESTIREVQDYVGGLVDLRRVRGRFKAIEEAVDAALGKAAATDGSWRDEPINWADLHCAGVEFVVDEFSDGRYVATIEEASPACPSLCKFVANELNKVGFGDVEVRTEW